MRRVLSLFLFAALCRASSAEQAVGLWWVAHGDGAPLQVRLYPDGTAWSDYSSNNPGHWSLEGQAVVCLWADNWKEKFEPMGQGWSKLGYRPGAALDGPPSNRSRAFQVSTSPDGWFGPSPLE